MHRFLIIYEQESTTQMMLCDFISKYCIVTGDTFRKKRSRHVTAKDIENCDIIIAVRSMVPLEAKIIESASKANKVCICFWDDDLTENTEFLFVPKLRRKAMIKGLKRADAVLCPNSYLAHKLVTLYNVPKGIVLDTAVDSSAFIDKKENDIVKIVYAAGPSHSKDFSRYLEDAFIMLQKACKGQFNLTFVGVQPSLSKSYDFPVSFVPCMELNEYREHMLNSNYDIGLAPLDSCEFSKSKYFNKYIEYTMVNVVGIYSKWLPYTMIIEDGKNGLFAEDSVDSWFDALRRAVSDPNLRKECLNNSKNQLKSDFSYEAIIRRLSRDIDSLCVEKEKEKRIKPARLYMHRAGYYIFKYCYLPCVYIKNEGFGKTRSRIKNYVTSLAILKEGDNK